MIIIRCICLIILLTFISSCCATQGNKENDVQSKNVSSGISERIRIGDCPKSTDLPSETRALPEETKALPAIIPAVIVPFAVNFALNAVSNYIKKREEGKSAVSTAFAYRQFIDPSTNRQCLIFSKGVIEGKPTEQNANGYGIPEIIHPNIYTEIYLDNFKHEASEVAKNAEKKTSENYIKANEELKKMRNTIKNSEKLKTYEEKRANAYLQWQKAKSNMESENFSEICPRVTYFEYNKSGAKTNPMGEKDVSLTPVFMTNNNGEMKEVYSHIFRLGKLKPGSTELDLNDNPLSSYNNAPINGIERPSTLIPCFSISEKLDNIFAQLVVIEDKEESQFNLSIAEALASEETKKFLIGKIQDDLRSDYEKAISEAESLKSEKLLREALNCSANEPLMLCVERIKGTKQ